MESTCCSAGEGLTHVARQAAMCNGSSIHSQMECMCSNAKAQAGNESVAMRTSEG